MILYTFIFYTLAAVIVAATAMAVTRRNLVHAVLYLVISFFGSAMLFYLLGAPFLAALEVIIYAGAIMVLFLFIVMLIDIDRTPENFFPRAQLVPALAMTLVFALIGLLALTGGDAGPERLALATAEPSAFGYFLVTNFWLMIEVVSMLLLVALIGALYLGRMRRESIVETRPAGEEPI